MTRLLTIDGLDVAFPGEGGPVRVLDGFTLSIGRGECLGVVGESGSGKSTAFLAVLGLLPPAARVEARALDFDGTPLLGLGDAAFRSVRGRRVAVVFQDPAAALNPYLTIGRQLTEVRETHFGEGRAAARAKAIEALTAVALPNPARALDKHPHELSGGQRQRAAIAMALLAEPALLVADEPTAALDPVVQRQILGLLLRLRQSRGLSLAVVSHDLGAHAGLADRVAVVYAGRVVEEGPAGDLLSRACHPYTRALVAAAAGIEGPRRPRLDAVPGSPPRPGEIARGCAFAPRCPRAVPRCQEESPPETILGDRRFRCFEPWT